MNQETLAILNRLAEKFGTTVEHLWGVLVKQAFISAVTDLFHVLTLLIVASAGLVLVYRKTRTPPETEKDRDPQAEWDGDPAFYAWCIALTALIPIYVSIIASAPNIISGFLNPEYWALQQILHR